MAKKAGNRLFGITSRFLMLIVAALLALSYVSIVINPAKIWLVSLSGIFFVPLMTLNVILFIWALTRRSKSFMIPLLAGAVPHLLAAMKGEGAQENAATEAAAGPALSQADALADASAKVQVDEYSEAAVMQDAERQEDAPENTDEPARKQWLDIGSAQLAFIVTLTAGSLLKGVLDIYGTTNRLLIAYPASALLILAFMAAAALKQSGKLPRIKCRETVNETITEAAE